MKVISKIEACSKPIPRSADNSVRWRASSCMRWSGLTPMSPALARRKARTWHQPVLHQIVHETLAELEFQHLSQPALRHVQHEERACDDRENTQLHQEPGKSRRARAS